MAKVQTKVNPLKRFTDINSDYVNVGIYGGQNNVDQLKVYFAKSSLDEADYKAVKDLLDEQLKSVTETLQKTTDYFVNDAARKKEAKLRSILEALDEKGAESVEFSTDDIDVLILTVLYETEFKVYNEILEDFKELTHGDKGYSNWFLMEEVILGVGYLNIHEGRKITDGKLTPVTKRVIEKNQQDRLKVLVVCTNRMGMLVNSLCIRAYLRSFSTNLKYVGSTGICGGIRGKCELEDVIIPTLMFDYSTGKLRSKTYHYQGESPTQFEPYWYPVQIEPRMEAKLTQLVYDLNKPTPNTFSVSGKSRVLLAPLATGTLVVANSGQVSDIAKIRGKLTGFDMELYGLAYSVFSSPDYVKDQMMVFFAKGVSDFGDETKAGTNKDVYQFNAALSSALVFTEIVRKIHIDKI